MNQKGQAERGTGGLFVKCEPQMTHVVFLCGINSCEDDAVFGP